MDHFPVALAGKTVWGILGRMKEERIMKNVQSIVGLFCASFVFVWAFGLTGDDAQAQEDKYLAEVIRDHVNNIVHYRDKLLREPHRPAYHFVVPEGIAEPFDPNGAIFWNGRYHLFYIFQDRLALRAYRGDSWGHVSSLDLVHWRWHPTALGPSGLETSIYSGNTFINKDGIPTIAYHGLGAGNCIATSTDPDLDVWKKSPDNPVVPYPENAVRVDTGGWESRFRDVVRTMPDYGKYDVWDPHAWLEGDTYYMLSGDNGSWPYPEATLWKSDNLTDWNFIGDFLHHDLPEAKGARAVDCPDFFKLGNKHVLVLLEDGCSYYIGEWKNEQFYPESYARMVGSGAPETMLDDKGRRILWAWVPDPFYGRADELIAKRGWGGTLTLPRVLTLVDGVMHMEPVEELQILRGDHTQLKNLSIASNSELTIKEVSGDTLELALTIDPGTAKQVGVKVRRSPGGEEETVIIYDAVKKTVRIELENSTLDEYYGEENDYTPEAPFELKSGEQLNLRIFLDRSIMEVYVNKRQCITQRIYPTREDSQGISLFSHGDNMKVTVLNAWKMHHSSPW
jgi:sucrose-6-phosphate hydrolase SacC (GH32 family)